MICTFFFRLNSCFIGLIHIEVQSDSFTKSMRYFFDNNKTNIEEIKFYLQEILSKIIAQIY